MMDRNSFLGFVVTCSQKTTKSGGNADLSVQWVCSPQNE